MLKEDQSRRIRPPISTVKVPQTTSRATCLGSQFSIPTIHADFPRFGSKSGLAHFRTLLGNLLIEERLSLFLA